MATSSVLKRPLEQSDDEKDTEKLHSELTEEHQMKDMLEESIAELQATVNELERRYDEVIDEGNEWKTRHENQEELNQLLHKQVIILQDRLDKGKESAKDGYEKELKTYDELSEASLRKLAKQLDREKATLESQLRDYEWRLDQESKAFHKANDERKNYIVELKQTQSVLGSVKVGRKTRSKNSSSTPRSMDSPATRSLDGNVPDNQRVLDPKKGPIKKTAAVKKLPKLDYNSY